MAGSRPTAQLRRGGRLRTSVPGLSIEVDDVVSAGRCRADARYFGTTPCGAEDLRYRRVAPSARTFQREHGRGSDLSPARARGLKQRQFLTNACGRLLKIGHRDADEANAFRR